TSLLSERVARTSLRRLLNSAIPSASLKAGTIIETVTFRVASSMLNKIRPDRLQRASGLSFCARCRIAERQTAADSLRDCLLRSAPDYAPTELRLTRPLHL